MRNVQVARMQTTLLHFPAALPERAPPTGTSRPCGAPPRQRAVRARATLPARPMQKQQRANIKARSPFHTHLVSVKCTTYTNYRCKLYHRHRVANNVLGNSTVSWEGRKEWVAGVQQRARKHIQNSAWPPRHAREHRRCFNHFDRSAAAALRKRSEEHL